MSNSNLVSGLSEASGVKFSWAEASQESLKILKTKSGKNIWLLRAKVRELPTASPDEPASPTRIWRRLARRRGRRRSPYCPGATPPLPDPPPLTLYFFYTPPPVQTPLTLSNSPLYFTQTVSLYLLYTPLYTSPKLSHTFCPGALTVPALQSLFPVIHSKS